MLRGFIIPQKGLALLARLHSGSTLEITRVMIGDGQVPDNENLRDLEDLVAPIAQATSTKPVTSREYPVSIGVAEGVEVVLGYMASAYMTAEDVEVYCIATILPMLMAEAQCLIDEHNADPKAHSHLQSLISSLDSRLSLLELMYNTSVNGNQFSVTFENLDGTTVTGVWNQAYERIEF